MAEEAKEAVAAKKRSKLPVILVLLLVLGGGGFFMVKGGGAKKKPEVKLGKIEALTEFLVNLKGDAYLKTEIALHCREGFEKKTFDENLPAIRDAIVSELSSRSLSEVGTEAGKRSLRVGLAAAVNSRLAKIEAGRTGEAHGEPTDPKKPGKRKRPDWDSDEGPVLKVYFTSFATQ